MAAPLRPEAPFPPRGPPRSRLLLGVDENEFEWPVEGKWPPAARLGVGCDRYASTSQYDPPVMPDGDSAAPWPTLCGMLTPVGIVTSRKEDGSGESVPSACDGCTVLIATGPAGGGVTGGMASGSPNGVDLAVVEARPGERGGAEVGWIAIGREDGREAGGAIGSVGKERADAGVVAGAAEPLAAEPTPPGEDGRECDSLLPANGSHKLSLMGL